jgi:signal transduction histidine kinase
MSSAERSHRLGRRVFVGLALLLLAVSLVFTAYFLHVQRQRLEVALADRGRGLGGLLATGARIGVFSENAELVQETLRGVVDRRDVLSAGVFAPDGKPIAVAGRTPALQAAAGQLDPRDVALAGRLGPASGCLSHEDSVVVDALCPVLLRQRPAAGEAADLESRTDAPGADYIGFVRVSLDRRPMRRELALLALRSLGLLAVVLVGGTWIGYLFTRRVTDPLERLTDAVRAFGAGGEIRELPRMPDDEIGRLAAAFAKMTRDIAEREREKEQLAERLREAQKLEAVGTLSQGISHDFKNILSTLNGTVHVLQKGSPGNEFVAKYATKMQVSLDRARELVERLVLFSRTRLLHAGPVDLTALLARLAPMLREVVGDGVQLRVELPGAAVAVAGDAPSLEQLLLNLAYNARDAMPQGGALSLRLESAAGAGGSGVARVTVRDNGVGMDAETRRRLFEPYFTTKDVRSGLGLGLSIVHGIVEQHHGRIEVESAPGEGTTFRVELPLLAGAADPPPPAPGPAGAGG